MPVHPARVLFDRVVAKQGGVVGLAQAVECGVSARTVQRHARDGTWERLRPAVYLVGGHDLDDRGEVRAAGIWAGEQGTVTGPAAAFWHGMLPRLPGVIDLTVPVTSRPRPHTGLRMRGRDLHSSDRVKSDGVWVADRAFAALETAVALADGSVFLDRALQKWVRFPTLYRAFCRSIGRTGSARAGALIRASADRAEFAAERLLVELLRGAGVTGWVLATPSARTGSTLRSPSSGWRSRWTGGPGTSTPSGSAPTGARATRSPGPNGPAALHLARPRRAPARGTGRDPGDAGAGHDRPEWDLSAVAGAYVPVSVITPARGSRRHGAVRPGGSRGRRCRGRRRRCGEGGSRRRRRGG